MVCRAHDFMATELRISVLWKPLEEAIQENFFGSTQNSLLIFANLIRSGFKPAFYRG
jgi:hypothetical protein